MVPFSVSSVYFFERAAFGCKPFLSILHQFKGRNRLVKHCCVNLLSLQWNMHSSSDSLALPRALRLGLNLSLNTKKLLSACSVFKTSVPEAPSKAQALIRWSLYAMLCKPAVYYSRIPSYLVWQQSLWVQTHNPPLVISLSTRRHTVVAASLAATR